jgi:hypothetical protein
MKPLQDIYKHKKSDIAVFLGCGSSINNITKKQWNKISKVDSWAVNNWLYHPFVPNFYHIEVKKNDKDIWKKRKIERGNDFKNTVFFINIKRRKILLDIIGNEKYIYSYNMDKINIVNEPIIPKYVPSSNPNTLICNLNASITMVLELICNFKYKKVIFFGVDLYNSIYFWTNRPEYGETHIQWNQAPGKTPNDPHNTAHLKNFIIWFSENRMKDIGGEFFVGHKDTLLYPGLKFIDIEQV